MNALKMNFTIPSDIAAELRAVVGHRARSRFVSQAIYRELRELEKVRLHEALVEGYQVRRDEDVNIANEWENTTLEGWG